MLTVIKFIGVTAAKSKYWECLCQCGQSKIIASKHFTTGKTQSCGCLGKKLASQRQLSHGESQHFGITPEYATYNSAKARCKNPNVKGYKHYGGRGIKFLFTSYEQFLAEVGRKPTPKHSLERIKNEKHYEPGNVMWATSLEQNKNRRNTKWITANGETLHLAEWIRRTGMNEGTLRDRIKLRWCDDCTINIPVNGGTCVHRSSIPRVAK